MTAFKMSFWTSENYLNYMTFLDQTGIQYFNRTGEQVIFAHALALFTQPEAVHQFGGIGPVQHRKKQLWGPGFPRQNIRSDFSPQCLTVAVPYLVMQSRLEAEKLGQTLSQNTSTLPKV
jgi:hypothetical protein